jgi:hypothetical protein
MTKRKVRCYKAFAHVAPKIYNYPVYYLTYGGWSNRSLSTCINCGELFVIDWENPETSGLNIKQIAASNKCPTCGLPLENTIQDYPKTIKLSNGQLGSFSSKNFIPSNDESLVRDFFELVPKKPLNT